MDDVLTLSGGVLVVAGLSFVVAGPQGMLFAGLLLVFVGVAGGRSAEDDRTDRINCGACGAVNTPDDDRCHYCDAPIEE